MHVSGIAVLVIVMALTCSEWVEANEPEGRHETKPLRFETVFETVVKTAPVTHTHFPTCTQLATDVPPCQHQQQPRTKRSFLSLPRNPRFPPRVNPGEARVLLEPSEVASSASSSVLTPVNAEPLGSAVKPKLIVVRMTTTLTTQVPITVFNAETTVGISYSGCVPSDSPQVSQCPSLGI